MEPKKRGRGRPPKPEEELLVRKTFRFPPALWARVEACIPPGERSDIVRACLEKAVEEREGGNG